MTLTLVPSSVWAGNSFEVNTIYHGWLGHQSSPSIIAWGTANRAIYCPLRVPRPCVVRKIGVGSSSTSTGNLDMGLYNAAGTRLVSSGSQTKLSSQIQIVDVTDLTISAGLYYGAVNSDSTTDTFLANTDGTPYPASRGVLTEAVGAVTLPSTATWAVDNTLSFQPLFVLLLVTELS